MLSAQGNLVSQLFQLDGPEPTDLELCNRPNRDPGGCEPSSPMGLRRPKRCVSLAHWVELWDV